MRVEAAALKKLRVLGAKDRVFREKFQEIAERADELHEKKSKSKCKKFF